jgi:hypothetical protein
MLSQENQLIMRERCQFIPDNGDSKYPLAYSTLRQCIPLEPSVPDSVSHPRYIRQPYHPSMLSNAEVKVKVEAREGNDRTNTEIPKLN